MSLSYEPGGIRAVKSRSEGEPLKRSGFPKPFKALRGATRYSEWHFVLPSP